MPPRTEAHSRSTAILRLPGGCAAGLRAAFAGSATAMRRQCQQRRRRRGGGGDHDGAVAAVTVAVAGGPPEHAGRGASCRRQSAAHPIPRRKGRGGLVIALPVPIGLALRPRPGSTAVPAPRRPRVSAVVSRKACVYPLARATCTSSIPPPLPPHVRGGQTVLWHEHHALGWSGDPPSAQTSGCSGESARWTLVGVRSVQPPVRLPVSATRAAVHPSAYPRAARIAGQPRSSRHAHPLTRKSRASFVSRRHAAPSFACNPRTGICLRPAAASASPNSVRNCIPLAGGALFATAFGMRPRLTPKPPTRRCPGSAGVVQACRIVHRREVRRICTEQHSVGTQQLGADAALACVCSPAVSRGWRS
jgi:hypothetical protein